MNKRQTKKQKIYYNIFQTNKTDNAQRLHRYPNFRILVDHKHNTFEIYDPIEGKFNDRPYSNKFLTYFIGCWNDENKMLQAATNLKHDYPDYWFVPER